MALRTILMSAAVLGAALGSAGTAVADPLVFNPSGDQLTTTVAPFSTSDSSEGFAADLKINGTPGNAGIDSFTETGSLLLLTFNDAPTSGIVADYNVYSTFVVAGKGSFTDGTFVVDPATLTAVFTLYGSPGGNAVSKLDFATPDASGTTPLEQFGVNPGGQDVKLGTANLVADAVANNLAAGGDCGTSSNCVAGIGASGIAYQNFAGLLSFTPAAGSAGSPGAVFPTLSPTNLLTLDIAQGDESHTTEIVSAPDNTTDFITTVTGTTADCAATGYAGNCPNGEGLIGYDVEDPPYIPVPEPGSLAILATALTFLGMVGTRRLPAPAQARSRARGAGSGLAAAGRSLPAPPLDQQEAADNRGKQRNS